MLVQLILNVKRDIMSVISDNFDILYQGGYLTPRQHLVHKRNFQFSEYGDKSISDVSPWNVTTIT
jgi:hypothetical protein